MPLTRTTITVASRIMLPTYVGLTGAIGLVYLLDPGDRLHYIRALDAQRILMPMPAWGLMFLVVAALMAAALIVHRRLLFVLALYVCASTFLVWTVLYGVSVWLSSEVSLLAPAYPFFVVCACLASARSLLRGEV